MVRVLNFDPPRPSLGSKPGKAAHVDLEIDVQHTPAAVIAEGEFLRRDDITCFRVFLRLLSRLLTDLGGLVGGPYKGTQEDMSQMKC